MRWISMLGLILLGWLLIYLREYDLVSQLVATVIMGSFLTAHMFYDWDDV